MKNSRRKEITDLAKEIFAAGYYRSDTDEDHRKKATYAICAAIIFYNVADEKLKSKSLISKLLG